MAEPDKAVFSYTDQAGKSSTSTTFITTGLTLAQIEEGLQALALLHDGVVGTLITGCNVLFPVDISGLTDNTIGVTADVEELGEFIGVTAADRKVTINVPGLKDNLSVEGSDDLDLTDSDIAAWITLLEDGMATTGGTIIPCDIAEADITAIVTAREMTRNSGTRK